MSGRLADLERTNPAAGWRLVAWVLVVLLAGMVVWANFTKLDEVSVAPGEVVPHGRIKTIQHLEGGIIQSIDVAQGDVVHAGDQLVQIDLGLSPVNQAELDVKLDALILNRARLNAEAKGIPLNLPAEFAARRPGFAAREIEAYDAHNRELVSSLAVQQEKIHQEEQKLAELIAKRRAAQTDLARTREIKAISDSLLEEGLTSKLEHIQIVRVVEKLQGELNTIAQSIPRAEAGIAEATERLNELNLGRQSEAYEELGRVEIEIARTRELLERADDQVSRTVIRSPIEGVVKNLNYNTVGGVIRPGEPIMDIVPVGERLVIEAHLHPIDRGYVQEGQRARVKISTYDFIRYGGLEGEVVAIAPDSTVDGDGNPYFRVVVETDRAYLGDEPGQFPITPGMQATVDIHTGERSVLNYLLRPVLKLRHEAFRER